MKTPTWGLCNVCYGIIPGELNSGSVIGVTLTKNCPTHGEQSSTIDPSLEFYKWLEEMPKVALAPRGGMTALTATDRCNLRCPGCYHHPDNSPDRSLESIVHEARLVTKGSIGLMGAEPTMRKDLPKLIKQLKITYPSKATFVYTNGIKLEDKNYMNEISEAGLDRVAVSLHLPNYVGKKAFDSKLKALENISETKTKLDHLSFSLKSLEDVGDTISAIMDFDYSKLGSGYVRLRAPSSIGGVRNSPCHMSDLIKAIFEYCAKKGLKVELAPYHHHVYVVGLLIEGKMVVVVRWPTVEEIDLNLCQLGAVKALFVPELGETNILHHVLIIERLRSGGIMPPSAPENCPPEISGIAI